MDNKAYQDAAARTVSDNFFEHIYNTEQALHMLANFQHIAANLDLVKKGMFYGKSPATLPMMKAPPSNKIDKDQFHMLLGLITEVAELSEVLQRKWAGEDVGTKVEDEFGDFRWYEYNLLRLLGLDEAKLNDANIAKLKARFPEKFSEAAAINRDEAAETRALEGGLKA